MTLKLALFLALLFHTIVFGQNITSNDSIQKTSSIIQGKKKLKSLHTEGKITIDGNLNEPIWAKAEKASDFIMFQPDNGKPLSEDKRTEVKIAYDDEAIYIGALLYDDPAKILKEITERDNFGTCDFFGVFINGYNDGQQDYRFFVSAAGTQMDCLATDSGEDYSWDGIWHSNVTVTNFGWVAEMKIPYAALRFSEKEKQTWGLNLFREIRRDRQKYTWNFINSKMGTFTQQSGVLEGIENIKTPTRLFLMPYVSMYENSNKNGNETKFKAGLDVKYGINDSFTLDAILVPDFGQTAFDDVVLNLGPFEQQFNENRPFFTEGTDLFNKGNLLYTRRIGSSPSTYPNLSDNEEVLDYPANVNLLNALKISGRTSKGLGIGVLNAITEKTDVTIQRTTTNPTPGEPDIIERRKQTVEPLANYNVLVLDQRFRKNSSVSLVNTSVVRNGHFRDANVTGLLFDLNTKANSYSLSGDFKYNYIHEKENQNGYRAYLDFSKTSGKFRYSFNGSYVNDEFDINDLGINYINNYHHVYNNISYRILNPNTFFNSFNVNLNSYAEMNNSTGRAQEAYFGLNVNTTGKKNDFVGAGFQLEPFVTYDFYQPMAQNRFVYNPRTFRSWLDISSNYNRKLALDTGMWFHIMDQDKRNTVGFYFNPRYRFSNKVLGILGFEIDRRNDDKGRVDYDEALNEIIFANRNRNTITTSLTGKYSISPKMTVNLKARYYWSYAENLNFLTLTDNGYFEPNDTYGENKNSNFKTWNFDLSYSWWVAPGSQLSVLYRNNAIHYENSITKKFIDNLDHTLANNLNNTVSVSFRYCIDYNSAKNWL
ncbi:DUF5916 domain-containing protein [Flavobacterium sp.]|uniref:DUF5916 domain-containing protein n=1 Tax=Flavobacterium sp. TaxID=239 RepID=UPI003D6BB92A